MEFIAPALLVLMGNLVGGAPGSRRWESVTAAYGWLSCLAIIGYMSGIGAIVWGGLFGGELAAFNSYMLPIIGFTLIQALTRDYERILRPLVDRWFDGA